MDREAREENARKMIHRLWPNRHQSGTRMLIRWYVTVLRRTRKDCHQHMCGYLDQEEFERTGLTPADGCGFVWSHDANEIHSAEQNVREHRCPRCGLGPWYMKYNRFTRSWALPGFKVA